ncbi:MAG: 3-oxoacyl-[acyl-carrier-protein] synthase III C-terminal domain-containing protein, partial [Pseudomonadota bacterium]
STRCATQFSNNIRNNNGYLRRAHGQMEDRRDMQFMQNGRKVFKEVLPLVSHHIAAHLGETGVESSALKRLWLHQANKTMNDYIGKKVLGRTPDAGEQPNILQDYANTSSAGSVIAFAKYSSDLAPGDLGLLCSFGAGYSVGSAILERAYAAPSPPSEARPPKVQARRAQKGGGWAALSARHDAAQESDFDTRAWTSSTLSTRSEYRLVKPALRPRVISVKRASSSITSTIRL